MKKIFTFPGIDLIRLEDYQKMFFWNEQFQMEIYSIENQTGQKGFLQNYLKNPKTDLHIENLDVALILFNAAQVAMAKMLEKKVGRPDLILTHSLGEYSAGVFNHTFNYKFLWDMITIMKPYGRELSDPSNTTLLIFGDINQIKAFCIKHELHIMSINSPTCALVWLGDRPKIKKDEFEVFGLSHLRFKLISYPIHTPLSAASSMQAMDDVYFHNIFEKHKDWMPHARVPLVSSTEQKVIKPEDVSSLVSIAKMMTALCRTPMDLTKTFTVAKDYFVEISPKNDVFENYVIESSQNFINSLREIDPAIQHKSGLRASTESTFKLLSYNVKVQDMGAFAEMGDSLGFIKKQI